MNLLFDLKAAQPMASEKRHGGGKYAEVLFKRMAERGIDFSCFYDSRKWLNPIVEETCVSCNIPLYDISTNSLASIVKENKITRVYSALPYELSKLDGCELFGTIHGLRDFETPADNIFYSYKCEGRELAYFLFKKLFPRLFFRRKYRKFKRLYIDSKMKLVTVSNHSKYSILVFFPQLNGCEIPVFYSPKTTPRSRIGTTNSEERYFLAVSGNRWTKNNLRAMVAFDRLVSKGYLQGMKMKVTGTVGNRFRYKIQNPDRFEFMGYVDDDKLEELYSAAFAFVYPSLNEGFGYPPLEAMKYGVPVIASPLSSITEVCGSAVLYFNPFSVEEIMNRMLMIVQQENHDEFSRKSLLRYEEISKLQEEDLDLLIDYITQ